MSGMSAGMCGHGHMWGVPLHAGWVPSCFSATAQAPDLDHQSWAVKAAEYEVLLNSSCWGAVSGSGGGGGVGGCPSVKYHARLRIGTADA